MRVGIILITYCTSPAALVQSVRSDRHRIRWYAHHHGPPSWIDDDLQALASHADARLHLHHANRGVARSWNDGLAESIADGDELTLLVNDDLVFRAGGFDRFVD